MRPCNTIGMLLTVAIVSNQISGRFSNKDVTLRSRITTFCKEQTLRKTWCY